MDYCKTPNKKFNAIIEELIKHENLNLLSKSNKFVELESTIRTIWKSAKRDKWDKLKCIKINENVNNILQQYKSLKESENLSVIQWRHFITNLTNFLTEVDTYKTDILFLSIDQCVNQLDNLDNSINVTYIKKWFKDFCVVLCECLILLHIKVNETIFEKSSEEILLHISQLCTCLKLMFKLFEQELKDKILITESRRFLVKCFKECFDGLKLILRKETDSEISSNFIKWMDEALDKVSLIQPNKDALKHIENAKIAIEEVLCHAMSIAQICGDEDRKLIEAGVQSVLRELNNLKTECNKDEINISVCNLYVDIVSDKLCVVERRINTVVLKIALKVFSDSSGPLLIIREVCEDTNTSILSRTESDLDNHITDFDMHVDCIIQVALFAIACSTKQNLIVKMRSCLASLEALESELVPSLLSLYMEPSKLTHVHASLFTNHWFDEVRKLQESVLFIIEPLAFGQVVLSDFKTHFESIESQMKSSDFILTTETVEPICKNVAVFLSVIKASLPELNIENEAAVREHYKNMKDIHHELSQATNILLKQPDRISSERIMKRCKILSTMFDRLLTALYQSEVTERKSPEDKSKESIKESATGVDISELKCRGQKMLKERSVLYKTPDTKAVRRDLKMSTRRGNISTRINESRRLAVSFGRKLAVNFDNKTMNLDVTDILEDITSLMDTLS